MTFRAAPLRDGAVTFSLGFTLGTHEGKASAARAEVAAELAPFSVRGGFIEVPIASLSSDDAKRDCHTREALGLDYAKSDFPGSHVCEDGKLPSEGKNAVAFPTIRFDIASVTAPDAAGNAVARGKWTIHGVTRESTPIPITITPLLGKKAAFRVHGSASLSLKEYGIAVKNFLLISVSDSVMVNFDLIFEEK
ncbi:MAG: YceI family protein [Deltaproteobacteria bacterium]|nr:YceI family protein [Deltaproteobacteria bacterium]